MRRPTYALIPLLAVLVGCPSPAHPDVVDATSVDAADAPPDVALDAGRSVGVQTRALIDSTRGTPANGDAGATDARQLPTDIYYPSSDPAGGLVTNGAVDRSGAPYPAILFVHGSSSSRAQSRFLLEGLAAAGYVVAAANFPLTAIDTPGGASDLHVDDQLGDLTFLANRLADASADATDPLANAVDTSHVLVVGHSTGGTVALLAAYAPDIHDVRIAGTVALAPCACFFGDSFFRTRALPVLIMGGTDDLFVPLATNGARAYGLIGPPRAFVTLVGGTHLYFTDIRLSDATLMPTPTTSDDAIALALARYGGGTACTPAPAPGTDPMMPFDEQHAHTLAWTIAFADAVLRHRTDALAALESTTDVRLQVQHDGI